MNTFLSDEDFRSPKRPAQPKKTGHPFLGFRLVDDYVLCQVLTKFISISNFVMYFIVFNSGSGLQRSILD